MIIGTIKKIITLICKGVYKLLCVFNLQFALLVAIIGSILFFCGVFEEGGFALIVFILVFIGSIVLALVLTTRKILGLDKKKEKKSTVQILPPQTPVAVQQPVVTQQPIPQTYQQPVYVQPQPTIQPTSANVQFVPPVEEKPKYFRVKQNPNYVMAEYSDRYELFQITQQGLKSVRVDYKR